MGVSARGRTWGRVADSPGAKILRRRLTVARLTAAAMPPSIGMGSNYASHDGWLWPKVDEDEQFYRDTESVAFPKLDDRQLAMLEPLGARRIVRRGELVFRAGQRDLGLTVVLRGELEVFESRDGQEQILATGQVRGISSGTWRCSWARRRWPTREARRKRARSWKCRQLRLRQALAELPGVSEPIVRAFIMRRQRLQRDREFAGLRICRAGGFARRPSAR